MARQYFDQKQLGASFFFSRGGGDVGHAGKFVTSIALQLAVASGAVAIVTSSSDEKLKTATKLGATHTINYKTTPDWEKEVLNLVS